MTLFAVDDELPQPAAANVIATPAARTTGQEVTLAFIESDTVPAANAGFCIEMMKIDVRHDVLGMNPRKAQTAVAHRSLGRLSRAAFLNGTSQIFFGEAALA